MAINKRLLVTVDDSQASHRTVSYVAAIIESRTDFQVRLFHVIAWFPPSALESPESEDVAAEYVAEGQWFAEAEEAAHAVFATARSILRDAEVPAQGVETKVSMAIGPREVAADILEEARASQCHTIVVGRQSFSRLHELFHHHVADELVRKGQGFTIWVVE